MDELKEKKIGHLLWYYVKHCPLFQSHQWIQTWATVQKYSIWIKLGNFWYCVTLKYDGWPWKTICHFKLCSLFRSHQSSQTGVRVRKRPFLIKIGNFFIPCDIEIWRMTLENNGAPLRCYFKLCASFRHHQWIQTRVTVRNAQFES